MEKNEIRKPVQKRSIEKRNSIIKAGFDLICEKGYHNTNTNEIARAAHSSVGIVYQYFNDKHDIFIEGINKYSNTIFYSMIDVTDKKFDKNDFDKILNDMIDKFVKSHKLSETAHREISALAYTDKAVADAFFNAETEILERFTNLLLNNGFDDENIREKCQIAICLIDDFCHEAVYHKHLNINYDVLKKLVIQTICNLF